MNQINKSACSSVIYLDIIYIYNTGKNNSAGKKGYILSRKMARIQYRNSSDGYRHLDKLFLICFSPKTSAPMDLKS